MVWGVRVNWVVGMEGVVEPDRVVGVVGVVGVDGLVGMFGVWGLGCLGW